VNPPKEYSVFFNIFFAVQGREVKAIPGQALRVPGS
jgi:hypothetical protein